MRYQGQSYTLQIDFSLAELTAWSSFAQLAGRFHESHQASFGYRNDRGPTEMVNVRLAGIGRMPRPELERVPFGGPDPSAAQKGRRPVYLRGAWHDAAVYERRLLKCGNQIAGP